MMKKELMKKELSAHRLRELLRAADPLLDDDGPRPDEVDRMRRAALAAARPQAEPRRSKTWNPAPAMAAAALLALASYFGFGLLGPEDRAVDPATDVVPPQPLTAREPAGEEAARRQQVQFVTADGTRVIWVLSSDLNL